MVVVTFAIIIMSKKPQWKKIQSTEKTQGILSVLGCGNPVIAILKMDYKYQFL